MVVCVDVNCVCSAARCFENCFIVRCEHEPVVQHPQQIQDRARKGMMLASRTCAAVLRSHDHPHV